MRKISFSKVVASGNDFVIVGQLASWPVSQLRKMAQKICDRKYGIGADGLLVLEKYRVADVEMRIFNPDGSEAEMCGNGARCVALYVSQQSIMSNSPQQKIKIQTKAGLIESRVNGDNVKIKLPSPKHIKLDIPVKINKRNLKVNFIDTGVPHAVIFVEGLDEIHVREIGRVIRNHKKFTPRGTNVDFVEILSKDSIGIRTYERGVEDETLACGTGAVASALITSYQLPVTNYRKINVHTKSGEILKVYFDKIDSHFKNVWLEGKAKIVYKGEYYV